MAAILGLCSLCAGAELYDADHIIIPASYINNSSQTYLLEKAAVIFGNPYRLTLTNIYLSEYWFCCDIVIEHFEDNFIVTQQCDNEYLQSQATGPGTTSSISQGTTAYDIVVHSEVRLLREDEEQNITVTYHFVQDIPNSGNYAVDMYDLVITFPYNRQTWTNISNVSISDVIEYYDLQGHKLNKPVPGIIIEKRNNVTRKVIY